MLSCPAEAQLAKARMRNERRERQLDLELHRTCQEEALATQALDRTGPQPTHAS
jgi:hypothetical protein